MKDDYVLLAVTGMSPQVVTETLFALYKQGRCMPKKIKIITTKIGKQQIWLRLGVAKQGQTYTVLQKFFSDYSLPVVDFNENDIWVVEDGLGIAMNDVVSDTDHQLMADFIVEKVRELTIDNTVSLHASLAGGRKTMTFFLGYALSLFGREHDELSHVLVTDEFEGLNDFYYPTPTTEVVESKNKTPLDASRAQVQLSLIPFVRMREDTPLDIINKQQSYSSLIKSINDSKKPPFLKIRCEDRTIVCNDLIIRLQPVLFYFYLWLVEYYCEYDDALVCPLEDGEVEYSSDFLNVYARYNDEVKVESLVDKNFKNGMTKTFFNQKKSKIKNAINSQMNSSLAKYFIIDDVSTLLPLEKQKHQKQFAVNIPSNRIIINS